MKNNEQNTAAVTDGVQRHYADQCEQYPHFCEIDPLTSTPHACKLAREQVESARSDLRAAVAAGETEWADMAWCAYWELAAALLHGNAPLALERCYSSIALHLRLAELLLGKLAEKPQGAARGALTPEQVAEMVDAVHAYLAGGNYEFAVQVGDVVLKCTDEGASKDDGKGDAQ